MEKFSHRKVPLLFVLSAPSGTGKSTLMHMLQEKLGNILEPTISCTTRIPRQGEKNDKDYYFVDRNLFEEMLNKGSFLEHQVIFGEYYGTKKEEVSRIFSKNKHAFAVIDTRGALNVRKIFHNAVLIFLAPPSQEEQLTRLRHRNSENMIQLSLRMQKSQQEYKEAKQFTYYVINDDVYETYEVIKSIIIAEEHKQRNNNE